MADSAIFIGWGAVVHGREQKSVKVFNDAVDMWTRLQGEGTLESWEAVFLEPHGGDLSGFFLLKGEAGPLAQLRVSDDFARLITRAGLIVESLGVVGADVGDRIATQLAVFQEAVGELA
jgi:hypothetical protein